MQLTIVTVFKYFNPIELSSISSKDISTSLNNRNHLLLLLLTVLLPPVLNIHSILSLTVKNNTIIGNGVGDHDSGESYYAHYVPNDVVLVLGNGGEEVVV